MITRYFYGNVLQSGKYEYGQTPSFSETPTKKNTAEYTYTFVGWAKENSSEVLDPLPDVRFAPVCDTVTLSTKVFTQL